MLDYDGSLISSILPPAPVKADLRAAQLKASEDERKKFAIANAIVRAKVRGAYRFPLNGIHLCETKQSKWS
jgi:CRISPR/Cas system-associated endonuclease Cas1